MEEIGIRYHTTGSRTDHMSHKESSKNTNDIGILKFEQFQVGADLLTLF